MFEPLSIPDVLCVSPPLFEDARGYFRELWVDEKWPAASRNFVQDNLSYSKHAVLRGLHLQNPGGQAKLISAISGAIWDVAVDVRVGSSTFGRWVAAELSATNGKQLFVPRGFAHGFVVLSESAHVAYKCDARYRPQAEITLRWNDPALQIEWPIAAPVLAPRDAEAPTLSELLESGRLPLLSECA